MTITMTVNNIVVSIAIIAPRCKEKFYFIHFWSAIQKVTQMSITIIEVIIITSISYLVEFKDS